MKDNTQGLLFPIPDDGEQQEPDLPQRPPDLQVFTVVPRGNFNNDFYEIGRAWKSDRCVWVRLHAFPASASMLICSPQKAQELMKILKKGVS